MLEVVETLKLKLQFYFMIFLGIIISYDKSQL